VSEVIIYAAADIQSIVAGIRNFVTAAELHLQDLQLSYTRLFASGWQDTEAVYRFADAHHDCMNLAQSLQAAQDQLGIKVDEAHLNFMAVDRSIAGELI
jgi:hypothetical protein